MVWHFVCHLVFRPVLLRMRKVSDKTRRGNQNTYFMFRNFFSESSALYEVEWKNTVEPGRLYVTIWRMRFACWVTKARNTHSEYVILTTFPLQQRLQEHASVLHYTYTPCLVVLNICVLHFLTSEQLSSKSVCLP